MANRYGEKSEYGFGFYNPPELVARGFLIHKATGFKRIPSKREILELDERWVDDLNTAYLLYAIARNELEEK